MMFLTGLPGGAMPVKVAGLRVSSITGTFDPMILMAVLPDGAVPVKMVGCTHNASIRPSQSTLELTYDLSIITIMKQQISRTA